jgi:hypothetical protein
MSEYRQNHNLSHQLFCDFSPDSNLFLHRKILKRLWDERHFFEGFAANGTRCRAQRVQTVYTGFAPCYTEEVRRKDDR